MLEIAWFILVVSSRTHVPELQGCDVLPQSALQGSGAPCALLQQGICRLACGCQGAQGTSLSLLSFAVVTVPTYIARAQKHLVFRALLSFPLVSCLLPGAVPLAAALGNPRVKSSFVKPLFDNVRAVEQQQGPCQTRQQGLRKHGYLLDFTWDEQNGPTAHHLHATGCCGVVQRDLVGK